MKCPECGATTEVIDSRWVASGSYEEKRNRLVQQTTRRRRSCPSGHRFTTYETVMREGVESLLDLMEDRIQVLESAVLALYTSHTGKAADAVRKIAGITQQEIATEADISVSCVCRSLRKGKPESHFDDDVLKELARLVSQKLELGSAA